jgi:hypothetical protein
MSSGGLPDPLKVHTSKDRGGMGWPDPLGLFDSGPSAPGMPDYMGMARMQGEEAKNLARLQARLNRPTESTPFGTRSWTEGPNDTWSSSIQYSPLGQNLLNSANKGYSRVEESFSKPFSVSGADELQDKVEKALLERQMPQFEKLRTGRLNDQVVRGHNPGTSGYDNTMRSLNQQENDMYSQAILNALKVRPQFLQEEMAIRNQPLNEINALVQGTQLQTPQFQNWQPQGPIQGAPLLDAAQSQGQFGLGLFGLQNQALQANRGNQLKAFETMFGMGAG